MATARQIVALVSSLNQGDDEQFFSIALQVAAAEAKRGRVSVANELRELVNQGRDRKRIEKVSGRATDTVIPITKPRGELQQLLHAITPRARLSDLFLKNEAKEHLRDVVTQQRQREQLRQHGLVPFGLQALQPHKLREWRERFSRGTPNSGSKQSAH